MWSAFWSMLKRMLRAGIRAAFARLPRRIWSSIFGRMMCFGCGPPANGRLSRRSERIFKRSDLPEPKSPEIQTPLALFSLR